MQITFDRRTINACLQQRFILPTYQRDYKWEAKHLQDLLNDVQEAFLSAHDPTHGRQDVLGYEPYFLGTIITTTVDHGAKAIIDGQQRITTLTLLLSYVHRAMRRNPTIAISPVDQAIRRKVAGTNAFNLDMDEPRKQFFELLIDGSLDQDELSSAVDSIKDKDSGTVRLWELFQQVDPLITSDITSAKLLPEFFDYLTECVCLFEIGVPREQDGHKVFVTMNDRGLKLGPIDLLKGFLLSSISNNVSNREAHERWTESMRKLQDLGSDEDSAFFKAWIRAKYAKTIRGKKRGDPAGDFEIVGDSYHRWIIDNKDLLQLTTSDDFSRLINKSIPFYIDLYSKIKRAESNFTAGLPHVFFNGARDLTLQAMVIISAVKESDTDGEVTKKVRAVSYYLDYLATVRVLNGKENTYDNIRDQMFETAKQLRNLPTDELKAKLKDLITNEKDQLDAITTASYEAIKRQDLLHLIGRITAAIENGMQLPATTGFEVYVDRTRDSKTFDIEHLLPDSFTKVNDDLAKSALPPFSSKTDFEKTRNKIGGLILLPRGRNRSMKDMAYSEKLVRYANENILAQTLTRACFINICAV
jgi:hypothetical protein